MWLIIRMLAPQGLKTGISDECDQAAACASGCGSKRQTLESLAQGGRSDDQADRSTHDGPGRAEQCQQVGERWDIDNRIEHPAIVARTWDGIRRGGV
jgi:hypothetical protein